MALAPTVLKVHPGSCRGLGDPGLPSGGGCGAAQAGPAAHSRWYLSFGSERNLGEILCAEIYRSHVDMYLSGWQWLGSCVGVFVETSILGGDGKTRL